MSTWLLSYMGRVKYSFIPKKANQRTNILHISNSKAPSNDKRYLLTSHNVNDVTERAPRHDKGNVTLMAWEAKQEFILHIATKLKLQSCIPGNNKVQTMFTPISMPDKYTRELKNNVKPTSKKLKISVLYRVFRVLKKTFEKWEKNNPSWACPCRIEKSHPRGRNLTRDSASLVPG